MGSVFSPSVPDYPEPEDPDARADAAAEEARLDLLARRLRGRAGTVATGDRGTPTPLDRLPPRRRLLGE
jgi:hypothetical protein